jgi:hypothetical protein
MNQEQQLPEAGRELDALVAVKVFDWHAGVAHASSKTTPPYSAMKEYSAKIEDAWLLVEKMREKGWTLELNNWARGCGQWFAVFMNEPVYGEEEDRIDGCADTAPLAICRAALLAVSSSEGV